LARSYRDQPATTNALEQPTFPHDAYRHLGLVAMDPTEANFAPPSIERWPPMWQPHVFDLSNFMRSDINRRLTADPNKETMQIVIANTSQYAAPKVARDSMKHSSIFAASISITVALWTLHLGAVFAATDGDKPNIIFILTDDLGFNQLGCYGDTPIKTPNLDRLANAGIRFTQAYAGNTVCSPSRVSLFTGRDGRMMENNSNTVQLRDNDARSPMCSSTRTTTPHYSASTPLVLRWA